jgi:serine protease Do
MLIRCLLAGGLAAACLALAGEPAAGQPPADPAGTGVFLRDLDASLRALSRRVSPAVVQIFVTRYAPSLGSEAAGVELFAVQRGSGSGVIVDPQGVIVTNAHVVEGAERIRVLLQPDPDLLRETTSILTPRGETVDARLLGTDSETDLAVLQVEAGTLPFLPLGDSDALTPGQLVFAFGSPLGLRTSVTMGVVSGLARQLAAEDPMIYIQTDASINPGNSGGPLVDIDGTVVGINTLIVSRSGGNEGLGFAAPGNIVSHVVAQIRTHGRVPRGEIGAVVQTLDPALAEALGRGDRRGVIVADVLPGGAADAAGLQVGDCVLSLDGKAMENGRQFNVNLYRRSPGDVVSLLVSRDQAERTLRVTVQERKGDPARFARMVSMEHNLIPRLGVLVLDIGSDLKRLLPPLRKREGVLVAALAGGGPPWESGLEAGDIIYTLNRRETPDVKTLKAILDGLPSGASLALQVERNGRLRYLTLELN